VNWEDRRTGFVMRKAERNNVKDIGIDWMIILKLMLYNRMGERVRDSF
jgi:hypothetical protein